jgi:glycosyltransferase involved in cell wall biosynthesis
LSTIRVVAIIEATTVTGPAKNLIRFATLARNPPGGETAVEVSIVTFCRGEAASTNAFVDAVQQAGLRIDVIAEHSALDRSVLAKLRDAIDQRKPDVVQTHGVKSHFLMRASGLHRRYAWIAFHHGYTAVDVKMLAYNQLDRWSLGAPRRVITVCGPFAKELERTGVARSRIEILPNSIESALVAPPERVAEIRLRLGLGPEDRVLLSIGRFSQEKAHIDLVAMAAELERIRPGIPFRVVLAGDGPERMKVEQAAGRLKRPFIFTGHIADVAPLFGIASVFVLPSYSEGSPNVLLEAMAAGVPVVATSVGGVPETIRDEYSGLLVPPHQPEVMAAKVARILDDAELARILRDNAAAEVQQRSPEAYRKALVGVYRSAMKSVDV